MPSYDYKIPSQIRKNEKLSFDPSKVEDSTRTIKDVIFTTGQRGRRYDWELDIEYYEELEVSESAIRTERLDKGLSIVDSHKTWAGLDAVFGHTLDNWRIENGAVIGDIRISDDEDSDKKYKKIVNGTLRHTSVGYDIYRMIYVGDADDGLPILRAVDWEITELSFVPVSFETGNGVRQDESGKPVNLHKINIDIEDEDKMNLKLKRMLRGAYQEPSTGNDPAPVATPEPEVTPEGGNNRSKLDSGNPAPAPVATPEPEPAPAMTRQSVAAEAPEFLTIGRRCGIPDDDIIAKFGEGLSLAEFRAYALDKLGDDSEGKIHARNKGSQQDQGEQKVNAAVQYLMSRNHVGTSDPIKLEGMARELQGMKLMDLARHTLGVGFGDGYSQHKIAQRAFQTTSDFVLILENVMHKMLQAGYTETARTFIGIPQVQNASDFREQHAYRLGDAPDLRPLNENGEYETGTFGSEKESFHIDTRARKIGVTRQSLINDDMSALSILPYMFGQAGSRMESDMFWGMVLNYNFLKKKVANFKMRDGKHLFDKTSHKNVIDGASSALSKDSISAIRKLGRDVKTIDDNYMNVEWSTFVFPQSLETKADDLLMGNVYAATPDNINSFRGKYNDVRIEPRLEAVADGDKAWFAFSNMIRAFVISYLDGVEGIYSEVINSTDSDGMSVLARKDFGVGMVDWRGAAKSAGK